MQVVLSDELEGDRVKCSCEVGTLAIIECQDLCGDSNAVDSQIPEGARSPVDRHFLAVSFQLPILALQDSSWEKYGQQLYGSRNGSVRCSE